MKLQLLAELSPVLAVREMVRHTDPDAPLAVGGSGLGAYLAQVNWGAIVAVVGLVGMTLGGLVIQLRKQYVIAELEIAAARRRLSDAGAADLAAPARV